MLMFLLFLVNALTFLFDSHRLVTQQFSNADDVSFERFVVSTTATGLLLSSLQR
jgi:hypothetical protein